MFRFVAPFAFLPFVATRWNRALSATQNLKRKLTCYALVFVHELFYCVIGLVLNSDFFLLLPSVLPRNVISQFKLTRRCSIVVVVVVVTCLLHGFPLRVIIILHPPILEPYPSTVSICVCVCRLPVLAVNSRAFCFRLCYFHHDSPISLLFCLIWPKFWML